MEKLTQVKIDFRKIFDSFKKNPGIKQQLSLDSLDSHLCNSKGEIVGFHKPSAIAETNKESVDRITVTSVNLGGIGGYETFYKSQENNPVPKLRSNLIVEFYKWLEINKDRSDIICIQDFPTIIRNGAIEPDFVSKISELGYELVLVPYVFHENKGINIEFRAESVGVLINRNKLPRWTIENIDVIPHFQNQEHGNLEGDYLNWNQYYNIDPKNINNLKESNPFWGQTMFVNLRSPKGILLEVGTFYLSPASSAIDRRRSLRNSIEEVSKKKGNHFICGDTNSYGVNIDTSKPLFERPLVRSFPFKIALLTIFGGILKNGLSKQNIKELLSIKRLCQRLGTNIALAPEYTLSKGPIKWNLDLGVTNTSVNKTSTEKIKFTDHLAVSWDIDLKSEG